MNHLLKVIARGIWRNELKCRDYEQGSSEVDQPLEH